MNSGTSIPKGWGVRVGERRRRRGGEKEEEEEETHLEIYREAPGEGGNSNIMGWRPQEWRGRNYRGEV